MITIGGEERVVNVDRSDNGWTVRVGDETFDLSLVETREGEAVFEISGSRIVVPFSRNGDRIDFNLGVDAWRAELSDATGKKSRDHDHSLSAPMPGSVLELRVAVGDQVSKGDTLIVLEAMKMEHEINSPWEGNVVAINCAEGDMVQPGIDLIEVEPAEGSETD